MSSGARNKGSVKEDAARGGPELIFKKSQSPRAHVTCWVACKRTASSGKMRASQSY